jgi:AraC-like DNA-binding protein
MNVRFMQPVAPQPSWGEVALRSGLGHGGYDIFQRVHYLDIADRHEGHASVRFLQGASGPSGLSLVKSTGHEIGVEEGRALTLLLPLSGQVFSASGALDCLARPGEVMILPRGRRRTIVSRNGADLFRAIVLTLPESPDLAPPRSAMSLAATALPDLASAARALQAVCASPADSGMVANDVLSAATMLLAGALQTIRDDAEGSPRTLVSDHALRRAEALMHDRFTEEISVSSVAEHAGISLRQLQEIFRRRHGLSPHAYLTRLRLEHVHLHLKAATPAQSVTSAALLSGFNHLGRFPASYRARFGVLPSRTLDRLK